MNQLEWWCWKSGEAMEEWWCWKSGEAMEEWWCKWNGGVNGMIEGAWTYLLRQFIAIHGIFLWACRRGDQLMCPRLAIASGRYL